MRKVTEHDEQAKHKPSKGSEKDVMCRFHFGHGNCNQRENCKWSHELPAVEKARLLGTTTGGGARSGGKGSSAGGGGSTSLLKERMLPMRK